ncbi:MAG: hypothetical protein FWH26_09185 [Oscillospiraceae bacterium]|nr:hypothetical protein [Oscillospiraceae bacterium]
MKKIVVFIVLFSTMCCFAGCGDAVAPEAEKTIESTQTTTALTETTGIKTVPPDATTEPYQIKEEWEELRFSINGNELKLPCTFGEFKEKTGFDQYDPGDPPHEFGYWMTNGYSVIVVMFDFDSRYLPENEGKIYPDPALDEEEIYYIGFSFNDFNDLFDINRTKFIGPMGVTPSTRENDLLCLEIIAPAPWANMRMVLLWPRMSMEHSSRGSHICDSITMRRAI